MSTPMKKYSTPAYVDNESGETEFGSVDVYLASEVDARIAELERALRDVKRFLEDPRWGTYPYMEGSDVYVDKDEALETINSVL